MPPKWTRKISRANPGSYYWNTNNIRGSYVPEPPGVEWAEANAERAWRDIQLQKLAEGATLPATTPRTWSSWLGYSSPAKVAPAPLTNPLSIASRNTKRNANKAANLTLLNTIVKPRGRSIIKYNTTTHTQTGIEIEDAERVAGTIAGLIEFRAQTPTFNGYLNILKRDARTSTGAVVTDDQKRPVMRHVLLLKKTFDRDIRFKVIDNRFGVFGKDILKGFSPEEIREIQAVINRVVAFARDENPELYFEEEYRIDEEGRGTDPATVTATIQARRAAAAPPVVAPPSAAALAAARIKAAREKLIANAQEQAEQDFAASAGLFNSNNAPPKRRPSSKASSEGSSNAGFDANSEASSVAGTEADDAEDILRAAVAAVEAAQEEVDTATPRRKAAAEAKLKAARAVAAAAWEAAHPAASSASSVEPLSSASSVGSSASSVASSSSSNSGSPLRVAGPAKKGRPLGFAALPHLRDGSNTDEGAAGPPVNSAAAAAAAAAVDPRAGVRFLLEQQAKARALKEALAGAKAVVGSSVDPALDAARAAAKRPPGVGAERAARANLERKEKARQAKLEEDERLARIFGLKPRKPKKGASKGGSRRKRRGKRQTKRR